MRWLLAAATLLLTLLAAQGPASADAAASDPADAAALSDPPRRVELAFGAAPDPAASHVNVLDATGVPVPAGAPRRSGDTLTLDVEIDRAGDYTIAYHVVLTDGGQRSGTSRFSVGTGVPPAGSPVAAGGHQGHSPDPVSAVVLVVDAIALLIFAVLLLRTRPRHRKEAAP
ncbi:hypothetical protein DMB66_47985 [Actinoplanes sp. ATCC 53533]|uniref:copper resistance CopC family protein n=1 Tax=Actinoplanes sp. ATCC 53533 TaxID=1288362 RepID=UPI000F7A7763|nr:copper resistance protein CopC [Actinoplanes sp. ATCC 53533]RSM47495.1 hypothetical protein DMB66_47985 [Actinoplanes sp. ATCC 53533]